MHKINDVNNNNIGRCRQFITIIMIENFKK